MSHLDVLFDVVLSDQGLCAGILGDVSILREVEQGVSLVLASTDHPWQRQQ